MSTCGYLLIARLVTVVQPRDAGRLQRVLRLQASPGVEHVVHSVLE